MLFDELSHIQNLASEVLWNQGKLIGKKKYANSICLIINFQEEEYFDVINWDNVLEPPAVMNLSDEDIKNMIKNGSQLEIEKPP